jgi:hypothetical protein
MLISQRPLHVCIYLMALHNFFLLKINFCCDKISQVFFYQREQKKVFNVFMVRMSQATPRISFLLLSGIIISTIKYLRNISHKMWERRDLHTKKLQIYANKNIYFRLEMQRMKRWQWEGHKKVCETFLWQHY